MWLLLLVVVVLLVFGFVGVSVVCLVVVGVRIGFLVLLGLSLLS